MTYTIEQINEMPDLLEKEIKRLREILSNTVPL